MTTVITIVIMKSMKRKNPNIVVMNYPIMMIKNGYYISSYNYPPSDDKSGNESSSNDDDDDDDGSDGDGDSITLGIVAETTT